MDQVPTLCPAQYSLQLVESVGILWCKENIKDWHHETFRCYSSDSVLAIGIAPLFGACLDMRSVVSVTTTVIKEIQTGNLKIPRSKYFVETIVLATHSKYVSSVI